MKRTGWLLTLVLLLAAAVPALTQNDSAVPEMTVRLAWEGYTRLPGWSEVSIILNNEGSDWEGELHIVDKNDRVTYRQTILLPGHSHKQYRVPLFVKDEFNVQVNLVGADGALQTKHLSFWSTYKTRLCVLADTQAMLPAGSIECDRLLLLGDLAALPETPMAWDTVDVMLINGLSTADLTAAQQEALLAWVSAGGHLIAGGGPSLPKTLSDLPTSLQVATTGPTKVFEQLTFGTVEAKNVAVTTLVPVAGAVPLVTVSGADLAVRGKVGLGHADILGWDLTQAQALPWLQTLWADDPMPALSIMTFGNTPSTSGAPSTYKMLEIPFSAIPTLWQWLLLFPFYVLIMGPGTLILVRRLRRPILAWALFPVWIVLALILLALGLSSTFSRSFPLVHEVATVLIPGQDLPARVIQGTAIYAPRTRRLVWHSQGAPRPLYGSFTQEWYNEGEGYPIEAQYLNASTSAASTEIRVNNPLGIVTWGSEGVISGPSLKADLRITTEGDAPVIEGSLWSEVRLGEATLLLNNGQYGLALTETVTEGVSVSISQPMTATFQSFSSYWSTCDINRYNNNPYYYIPSPSVYEAIVSDDIPCFVVGTNQSVPFPAQSGGTHIMESCLVFAVPCPVQSPGALRVPLESVLSETENGWVDDTGVVYVSAPATTVLYRMPDYLRIQKITKLTIELLPPLWMKDEPYSPAADIAELSLWNWEREEWIDYPAASLEKPLVLTGTSAERVFDGEQGVRVRLKPHSELDGSASVDLLITIDGNW